MVPLLPEEIKLLDFGKLLMVCRSAQQCRFTDTLDGGLAPLKLTVGEVTVHTHNTPGSNQTGKT
jgi:hypothetical protein